MSYHLKYAQAEWAIEAANKASWVLKKKADDHWEIIGNFRTPNEAAVIAGAATPPVSAPGKTVRDRLSFVLSVWETAA